MKLKTCVTPEGHFIYGVHRPSFTTENYRENSNKKNLGFDSSGRPVTNHVNLPEEAVKEPCADTIYEVLNPFPFRGATYIASNWADQKSTNPDSIKLNFPSAISFTESIKKSMGKDVDIDTVFSNLPLQILVTIAAESHDKEELTRLASMCCEFHPDIENAEGLVFTKNRSGNLSAVIKNHTLFETLVNNPNLPDCLKETMVLRPGIQGNSEIVGEYIQGSHVYEYLRRNSYIPWGHFAANMAEDAVRYDMGSLSIEDMKALRHLYYQRTYSRVAEALKIPLPEPRKTAKVTELEEIRKAIVEKLKTDKKHDLFFSATLWGWNYGFNFTSGGYNLHGSHQQIHQQYALIPEKIAGESCFSEQKDDMETYCCGDQVYSFIRDYRKQYNTSFFEDYIKAIRSNRRMDSSENSNSSLVIYEDDNVLLFVPKAQTSQWELNLITKKALANIIETETEVRNSIDLTMHKAMKVLTSLGARMISVIEFSGRFGVYNEKQHLLYSFLPKIPYSMGAFTEAQQRFINGHYPEDFASACRNVL